MGRRAESPMDLHVDCHAGHRGEETPRRFALGSRHVEVLEVVLRASWVV
jgi:hypothetical protein